MGISQRVVNERRHLHFRGVVQLELGLGIAALSTFTSTAICCALSADTCTVNIDTYNEIASGILS